MHARAESQALLGSFVVALVVRLSGSGRHYNKCVKPELFGLARGKKISYREGIAGLFALPALGLYRHARLTGKRGAMSSPAQAGYRLRPVIEWRPTPHTAMPARALPGSATGDRRFAACPLRGRFRSGSSTR